MEVDVEVEAVVEEVAEEVAEEVEVEEEGEAVAEEAEAVVLVLVLLPGADESVGTYLLPYNNQYCKHMHPRRNNRFLDKVLRTG